MYKPHLNYGVSVFIFSEAIAIFLSNCYMVLLTKNDDGSGTKLLVGMCMYRVPPIVLHMFCYLVGIHSLYINCTMHVI